MAEDKEMFLNTCLEEYKTLREEVRQASVNMITSLTIGLGVTVAIVLAGINLFVDDYILSQGDTFFLLCIFCIILPLLLGLITAFWLGELARFKRAGNYIYFIEKKVSILLNDFYEKNVESKWKSLQKLFEEELNISENKSELGRPLQWETWLRSFDGKTDSFKENIKQFFSTSITGHMKWIYIMRLMILSASFWFIWITGAGLFLIKHEQFNNIIHFKVILIIFILASFFSYLFLMIIAWKLGQKQIITPISEHFSKSEKYEH